MPSKKKGQKGRAAAAEPALVESDPGEPSASSSFSGSQYQPPSSSAVPSASSATARLIEGIGKSSPNRFSPSSAVRDAPAKTGGGSASSSQAVKDRISPKSASSTAAATAVELQEPLPTLEAPDTDEFQDALEELAQGSDHQGEEEEDPLTKLLAKDPLLQIPTPSRANWEVELETLGRVMEDAAISDEEKVRLLHDAYGSRAEDLKNLEEHRTAAHSHLEDIKKERERCTKETAIATATKAKLEDTCRELQQMKTTITVESKRIVEDERERQTELNNKFDGAMKEVEEKMQAETEVREHFVKENEELRQKLNNFRETYAEQERQISEQNALRMKEMQGARDRLKEYEVRSAESSVNATTLEKKNKGLKKTNQQLKDELQSILGKFDEFHESVNGSSKKHGECKEEIDALSASLKVLDEENVALKANKQIDDLTKERDSAQRQCDALEKLIANLEKEIQAARERLSGAGKRGGS